MQFDFPTILFLAALVTGVIWGLDALLFARRRAARASEERPAKEPLIVEYSRSFFPIILIVLVLRSFLVEPFRIPSGSMMPTLRDGDFILVNKFTYGIRLPVINQKIIDLGRPERGDVVVFRYPENPTVDYIKRVVGLPGDHIAYRDKRLYVNGEPLQYEDLGVYQGTGVGISMSGASLLAEQLGDTNHQILLERAHYERRYDCMIGNEFTVPEGKYFVMGDNRDNSNDSRFWCAVPDENLIGKAFLVWMNWDPVENTVLWSRIGDSID